MDRCALRAPAQDDEDRLAHGTQAGRALQATSRTREGQRNTASARRSGRVRAGALWLRSRLFDAGAARWRCSARSRWAPRCYFAARNLPSYSALMSSQTGPDHRGARARRHRNRLARAELRPMADLRRDPAGDEGCDGLGRGPPLLFAFRRRSDRADPRGLGRVRRDDQRLARDLDDHPAAGAQHLPQFQPHARPQAARGGAGDGAGMRSSPRTQILELYLNKVYFGGGAYGIDSASRKFFSHSGDRASPAGGGDHRRPGQGAERAIRPPPMSMPRSAAANVVLEPDAANMARSPPHEAAGRSRRGQAQHETGQNSVRYFTDWALPQLDLLLPDDNTSRSRCGPRSTSACSARRPRRSRRTRPPGAQGALVSLDRDGAVLAMVGGTDYVEDQLQPRGQRGAPARIGMEAVRLSRRARGGLHARRPGDRRAGDDRRLEPAQFRRQLCRRNRCAQPPSPIRRTPSPRSSATKSASARSPRWRGASASPRRSRPSLDGARHLGSAR